MQIQPDQYLNRLLEDRGNRRIKIVTGVRRCGKSYLLFKLFKDRLIREGVSEDHIIEIVFDDRKFKDLRDPDECYRYVTGRIDENDPNPTYVLLDEVQLMKEFEDVLNGFLHLKNADVFVTGSNSKFLSTDIQECGDPEVVQPREEHGHGPAHDAGKGGGNGDGPEGPPRSGAGAAGRPFGLARDLPERVQAEQEGQGRVADPHDPDDPLPAVGRGDVPPRELGQEPARTGEARPGQRGDVGRDDERHDEEPLQNPLPPDVGVGDEPCLDEPHGGREERRSPDDADGVEDARAHALGGRQVRVDYRQTERRYSSTAPPSS